MRLALRSLAIEPMKSSPIDQLRLSQVSVETPRLALSSFDVGELSCALRLRWWPRFMTTKARTGAMPMIAFGLEDIDRTPRGF